MASRQDPRKTPKAEIRRERDTNAAKDPKGKRPASNSAPVPKPLFTDWAAI